MRPGTVSRIAGIAAITAIGVLAPLGAAGAADYPTGGNPPAVVPEQQPTAIANKGGAKPSTLPLTGTDVGQFLAIGGAAAGAGFLLVRRSRRTTHA